MTLQKRSKLLKLLTCLFCLFNPIGVLADPGAAAASAAAKKVPGILCSLKNIDYRYFVAGGVCAATSHGITTPIDVVKTRMQAEPQVYNKGVTNAAVSIIKTDGVGVLTAGLGPTVAGYGVEGALKFGVYEVLKPITSAIFQSLTKNSNDGSGGASTGIAYVVASVLAGAVASMVLCPMESTRIRIVTDKEYADKGLFSGLAKLLKEEGLWSTFGGMYAMLAKQVPYTMAKQVSFDIVARQLYALFGQRDGDGEASKVLLASLSASQIKWVVSICAAFIASLLACIFSQPGDMILTETYKSKTDKGVWGVVSDIYKTKGGIPGFFVGTGARIIHVGLIITSQLVIYDIVKQLLGLPATGSH